MAVQQNKKSPSRRGMHRSHDHLSAPAIAVEPFPGSGPRALYLYLKVAPTPDRFPRRPGMARKRPLGG